MSADQSNLLMLAGGVLGMMIVLAVLKSLARSRALAARRAHRRLLERAEARSEPFPGP